MVAPRQISALDVLPISALRPTLAALGDSITAGAITTTATISANNIEGYLTWANILTRQRFYSPQSLNFGVSGDTIQQMRARIGAVLAAKPDICIVHAGTNNNSSSATTLAQDIIDLGFIYDSLSAIGCTIIAVPVLGRSGAKALASSAQRLRGQGLNHWIRSQVVSRQRFYVADCGISFDDPASTTWTDRSGYTLDGLHPNGVGAPVIGAKIASILNFLYPDWRAPVSNAADLYDADVNPRGNLLTNGAFAGGTTTATGWTLATGTALGATATASKVLAADGRNAQRLTLSGTYTGSNGIVYLSASAGAASINPGDTIDGLVEFANGTLQNIAFVSVEMRVVEGGVTYQRQGLAGSAAWPAPDNMSGLVRTPTHTFQQVPTSVTFRLGLQYISPQASSAPISGQVDFMAASIRKVL